MADFMQQLNPGLYAVDCNDISKVIDEYDIAITEADALVEIIDPDSTPYRSKYTARDVLDKVCNKLEATTTVATLEAKSDVINEVAWRVASLRVRLAVIAWECEEPHNAQIELDGACDFFFPGVLQEIYNGTADEKDPDEGGAPVDTNFDVESLAVPILKLVSPKTGTVLADSMKCLNMLGILWAGRGHVKRSLMFLIAAKNLYDDLVGATTELALPKDVYGAMDDAYTHTLFYLAQAYGNIGDLMRSCEYCQNTLQRQLDQGLDYEKGAFDWVKNCVGLVGYYSSVGYFRKAALVLASLDRVLQEKVIAKISASTEADEGQNAKISTLPSSSSVRIQDARELEAEIDVRRVRLDVTLMKRAFDRELSRSYAEEIGAPFEEETDIELEVDSKATDVTTDIVPRKCCFFKGLEVEQPLYFGVGEICSFETARDVYLRAAHRIESAKKVYVLDGCVTDHVNILLDHSKLYHYLAIFEVDLKRKLAMETRRVTMLRPLLTSLNKSPFEGLHKQISYELGETYLALVDIKTDKVRASKTVVHGILSDETPMKRNDALKINEYCRGALAMFAHFASFYAAQKGGVYSKPYLDMTMKELADMASDGALPDESLIASEEVRPFLNCHFLACRALTKIVGSVTAEGELSSSGVTTPKSWWIVCALHRYKWLVEFGPKLCASKNVDPVSTFGQEFDVCRDMAELLPSKIDRMHFLGDRNA